MNIRVFALSCVIVASALYAAAQGPTSGPATSAPTASAPAGKEYKGVVKFWRITQGASDGRPYMLLIVSPVENDREQWKILIPEKADELKDIDFDVLKFAWQGDLLEIEAVRTAGAPKLLVCKAYDPTWGEADPNVFIFVKKVKTKVGETDYDSIEVMRFLKTYTVLVPNRIDSKSGKKVPDAVMINVVDGLKEGDQVECIGSPLGGKILMSAIRYCEPYQKFEYVRAVKEKVGKEDLPAIAVKTPQGPKALVISSKNPNRMYLSKAALKFALGELIIARTVVENDITYLLAVNSLPTLDRKSRPQPKPWF